MANKQSQSTASILRSLGAAKKASSISIEAKSQRVQNSADTKDLGQLVMDCMIKKDGPQNTPSGF
ncbi:hypothetical protein Lbir_2729 [Legionella birminghamensis]|uniref:Uncharacterized protein n=1 Tax=Legionella birminghamensis TaxID=28083 RepID=A0A378I7Z4_9GAMM|nr:hypothetical protein [Legionella birminghamensis]KTC68127.1 hypothetical protein Lbir_2729 [Legionella birminghamensis]STX31163.1 Uncharacterised protein [Legionella birminghamensis]